MNIKILLNGRVRPKESIQYLRLNDLTVLKIVSLGTICQ